MYLVVDPQNFYVCCCSTPLSPAQQEALIAEKQQLLEANAHLLESNQQLREEVKELRPLLFGSKRERFVPQLEDGQLSLDLASSSSEPAVVVKQTVIYERAVKQIAKKATRGGFPSHLPRVDVMLEPQEDVSGMRKMNLPIRSCILGPERKSLRN